VPEPDRNISTFYMLAPVDVCFQVRKRCGIKGMKNIKVPLKYHLSLKKFVENLEVVF
jgi:hypothetical protein